MRAGLVLVAPRAAPDDHRALVVGRAARERLASARVVGSLDDAVAEASVVVGFTARAGAERPLVPLARLGERIAARDAGGRVSLVFGPEDTGLVAADVDRADLLSVIETTGPLASLNLAQAVGIALYALSRAPARPSVSAAPGESPTTRAAIEALVDHAFAALDALGYFARHDRAQKRVHLRRVLAAAALTTSELGGLHGVCAAVLHASRAAHRPPSDGD